MKIDPVTEAELIKEGARIDPETGRMPENRDDPECDHACGRKWEVRVVLDMGPLGTRTRRLCLECTNEFLEWV